MVSRRLPADVAVAAALLLLLGRLQQSILPGITFSWPGARRRHIMCRPSDFSRGQRAYTAKVPLHSYKDFQPGRRMPSLLLVAETLGLPTAWGSPPASAESGASTEDVELLRDALMSVRKLGDFPSRSVLADADAQLTAVLSRWQQREGAASPSEVSGILRRRADVRFRSGKVDGALQDLGDALQICKKSMGDSTVKYEELPRVLIARAQVLSKQELWGQALEDFDFAADLLGEPLEDVDLLSGRACARRSLDQMAAAAADFNAAADMLRSKGQRPEAEIEAESAAVALLAAGEREEAESRLCDVIRRCVGLLSEDVSLLQRVVIADSDARMVMAAISWHKGQAEVAETYWRDGCSRIDILADEAQGKKLAIGFPYGEIYGCSRYAKDRKWLREVRHWPEDAIAWLQDFLQNRPSEPPRGSYVQDLMTGRRPGDGSTILDLAIATDVFRRSDPLADLQTNLERSGKLDARAIK